MNYLNLPNEALSIYNDTKTTSSASGKSEHDAHIDGLIAVQRSFIRNVDGTWERKSVVEFSAYISKASISSDGVRRWAMTASDTGKDVFEERMSVELYKDFVSRIERNEQVPVDYLPFIDEKSGWSGGMPYISISHYRSGKEGNNVPGMPEAVYVDGDALKAKGYFFDTPLGIATHEAIRKDRSGISQFKEPVRVSIGFLDYAHSHGSFVWERKSVFDFCPMCEKGVGNKVYLKGQLVHLAFTRKPARVTTSVEVERMAEGEILTVKDDAESIVGKELAESLEINKSTLAVEEKSEPAQETAPVVEEQPVVERAYSEPEDEEEEEDEEEMKKDKIEKAYYELRSVVDSMKGQYKDIALPAIQEKYNNLGEAIKEEFESAPTSPKSEIEQLRAEVTQLKSELEDSLTAIRNAQEEIAKSLGAVAKSNAQPAVRQQGSDFPAPKQIISRGLTQSDEKPSKILELAKKTVMQR